jgi:Ni/Fe-hydrogenase 1 B-type cytochrome subunit
MTWLDVVFTLVIMIVPVALLIHFIASIPVGRFKKKWILKQWPQHEEPHPPALPKFIHFTHLACMFALGITGMLIHFNPVARDSILRPIHYVAMIIVTVNLIWRFWYAFGSKRRDWRAFAITKADVKSFFGVAAYYAFISNKKPHTDKYNVMQKGTYLVFALFMLMQVFCGFALITDRTFIIPLINMSPSALLLGWWLAPITGDLPTAVLWMRVLHYFLTWMFIILTTIHMYLSATEDIPVTLDFFGLGSHEEHDAGHGDALADVPAPSAAE